MLLSPAFRRTVLVRLAELQSEAEWKAPSPLVFRMICVCAPTARSFEYSSSVRTVSAAQLRAGNAVWPDMEILWVEVPIKGRVAEVVLPPKSAKRIFPHADSERKMKTVTMCGKGLNPRPPFVYFLTKDPVRPECHLRHIFSVGQGQSARFG